MFSNHVGWIRMVDLTRMSFITANKNWGYAVLASLYIIRNTPRLSFQSLLKNLILSILMLLFVLFIDSLSDIIRFIIT